MTLIVGILCQDGVVMASDSAATFAAEGLRTIGQQEIRKVYNLSNAILYSSTGAIGISQVISNKIKTSWDNKSYSGINTPEDAMDKMGKEISQLITPYLQSSNLVRGLVGSSSTALCKSLVAMQVKHESCLFQFDFNGAPERATKQLPFIALGSGQQIADPFLAFLKRLLWERTEPTLSEGRLAAIWTIDHVRRTNPGGVGGSIQVSTLTSKPRLSIAELTGSQIDEHLQQINDAEQSLVNELKRVPSSTTTTPITPPPTPPKPTGP